ncbi:MAG: hypothetical protein IT300_03945 [Dehalococcoidia bacterium]|nr:hypothetical protein [Dehalococcoidia bacterium]
MTRFKTMEELTALARLNLTNTSALNWATVLGVVERCLPVLLRFWCHRRERYSYENLRFDLSLTLHDAAGRQATLRRTQSVRFRTAEAGIVRDVVWGEGEQFADYCVSGADLVGVRNEGPSKVALLDIHRRPAINERAELAIDRLIKGGFLQPREYIETELERPTKLLRLKVGFPRGCTPRAARVELSPPLRSSVAVPVELDASGRPELSWSTKHPLQNTRYRLVWSW